MPTILISVFNKDGLEGVARKLTDWGWNILASGGTAKYLAERAIQVQDVATLVGEPILGHRVVTLSREVHAGLLAQDTQKDRDELDRLRIPFIDAVYVNLYPLAKELASPEATIASLTEKTDIGGPTMLRAAAKGRRLVAPDSDRMNFVLAKLAEVKGDPTKINLETRRELAHAAERAVTAYGLASCAALTESESLRRWYATIYESLTDSPLKIRCKV